MKRSGALHLLAGLVCCGCPLAAIAASGTWSNLNGGSWTNAGNWNAGIIADGSGNTANFATLSLPADVNGSLDGARVIGHLSFDDEEPDEAQLVS